MIQKGSIKFFVFMVVIVMASSYGLNSQLKEMPFAIEVTSETENASGSIQSDCDYHEDENFKHSSCLICVFENTSTSFSTIIPSVIKSNCFDVWQPPKSC